MIETIPALLHAAGERFGDKTFLVSPSEPPIGFANVDGLADRVAMAAIADGLSPGDRVAVWAPNRWEWVAAAVGAQRAGATLVPLNSRYRGSEVADIVNRAGVKLLFAIGDHLGQSFPEMLRSEDMPGLRRVVVFRTDPLKLAGREQGWESFLALGEAVPDAILRDREATLSGETISDIMFTSGTTGRPKGAVFNHRSAMRAAEIGRDYVQLTERDCFSPLGEFSTVGGYKVGWLSGALTGATICWSDAHDFESVLNFLADLKVTAIAAPPITWQLILDSPLLASRDISNLRFAATGGSVIPPKLVERLMSELNVKQVGTGYGMTETCGMNSMTYPDDPVEKVAYTAGRPAPDAEIRILGADGDVLGPEQTGEILISSPRLLIEYLDDPAATRDAIDEDGWFHSGDVGLLDADGYLKITDRLKDMYITNGFNVYPAEIERLMGTMPGVEQCAVIGVPDPRLGEFGRAFIVRRPGFSLTEADVIAWCRQKFANYKTPRQIVFVDQLPRNPIGKVIKSELRNLPLE